MGSQHDKKNEEYFCSLCVGCGLECTVCEWKITPVDMQFVRRDMSWRRRWRIIQAFSSISRQNRGSEVCDWWCISHISTCLFQGHWMFVRCRPKYKQIIALIACLLPVNGQYFWLKYLMRTPFVRHYNFWPKIGLISLWNTCRLSMISANINSQFVCLIILFREPDVH